MVQINSYLTFNGNCREAMKFYQDCLGGELNIQTIGESPLSDKMPVKMKNAILHAFLKNQNVLLMGSDMVSEKGLSKGNSVSLVLRCSSEDEIRSLYQKLSSGGERTHQLGTSFWGALFGTVTDRFGNHWMLVYDENSNQPSS